MIMAQADYIPAGRTSRIVRGNTEIQIQTEYAYRPVPRLTTSLFTNGRIINKIEQELAKPVDSFEAKMRVEDMLRKQHLEVLKIIKDHNSNLDFMTVPATGAVTKTSKDEDPNIEVIKKLVNLKGVEKVFRLDNNGNFLNSQISIEFRKKYAPVFKGLSDILNIFTELPGGEREKGVYEIERNRLYFASSGRECYFILVQPVDFGLNFEKNIKEAISV